MKFVNLACIRKCQQEDKVKFFLFTLIDNYNHIKVAVLSERWSSCQQKHKANTPTGAPSEGSS